MPAEVPEKFTYNSSQYELWRTINRLQEDFKGTKQEFIDVLVDVEIRLENSNES